MTIQTDRIDGIDVETEPITAPFIEDEAPAAEPQMCPCGKREGDDYAHGARTEGKEPMSCEEVLAIAARVAFSDLSPLQQFFARRRGEEPKGWRLTHDELIAVQRAQQDRARRQEEVKAEASA